MQKAGLDETEALQREVDRDQHAHGALRRSAYRAGGDDQPGIAVDPAQPTAVHRINILRLRASN
jgi:hypothetical protein